MRTGSTAERLCPIAASAATGGISPLKTVRRLRPPAQAAPAAMAVQRPATNRRAQRAVEPAFSAASGTYPFAPIHVHTADGISPRTELLAEGLPTPVPFASKPEPYTLRKESCRPFVAAARATPSHGSRLMTAGVGDRCASLNLRRAAAPPELGRRRRRDRRGVQAIEMAPTSASFNSFAELSVLSIKSECLNKLILLGERHLRLAVDEFVALPFGAQSPGARQPADHAAERSRQRQRAGGAARTSRWVAELLPSPSGVADATFLLACSPYGERSAWAPAKVEGRTGPVEALTVRCAGG